MFDLKFNIKISDLGRAAIKGFKVHSMNSDDEETDEDLDDIKLDKLVLSKTPS